MKRYAGSIIAVVGALFFLPGFVAMLRGVESFSAALILMGLFYLFAIVLGMVGAVVALNKPAPAAKILAVATLGGVLVVLLTLFLSTSLEGLYFRYTIMGLFFIAISTAIVGKQKTDR
jgi:peptidoglycan/LPS O-acetylase OafA/YrhL